VWFLATNDLTYINSLKMKLAVILGVVHMSFGIIMKGANALYFKSPLDFLCEFVP